MQPTGPQPPGNAPPPGPPGPAGTPGTPGTPGQGGEPPARRKSSGSGCMIILLIFLGLGILAIGGLVVMC